MAGGLEITSVADIPARGSGLGSSSTFTVGLLHALHAYAGRHASAYSGVLSLFMTAILDRRSPTIFGDGETSRDFTYVEDVVGLNLKAAKAITTNANNATIARA